MPIFSLLYLSLFKKQPRLFWVLRSSDSGRIAFDNPFRPIYDKAHKKAVAWHKCELKKLDFDYRLEQAGNNLILAEIEAQIDEGRL